MSDNQHREFDDQNHRRKKIPLRRFKNPRVSTILHFRLLTLRPESMHPLLGRKTLRVSVHDFRR